MRTIALRPPGHVSNKTLALVSGAVCLTLLVAVIAIIVARSHTRASDSYGPIMRETQDERELRMGWAELGAVAAADPPPAATTGETSAAMPNQSLLESPLSPAHAPIAAAQNAAATSNAARAAAETLTPSAAPPLAISTPAPIATPSGSPPTPSPVAATGAPAEVPCGTATCTGGAPGEPCSQNACG